ncbi:MAG: hypothetical protein ACOCVR_00395, partial [Myxococcota bacterium]
SDSATLASYTDAGCSDLAGSVVIPAGTSTASFHFSDSEAGSPIVTVSATGFSAASQTQSILAAVCDGSQSAPTCTSDADCVAVCDADDCHVPTCVNMSGAGEQISVSSLAFDTPNPGGWTVSAGHDTANQGELYMSANDETQLVLSFETQSTNDTFNLWVASGRVDQGGGPPASPTLQVLVDGAAAGTVTENNDAGVMTWTLVSSSQLLAAGQHELTFSCTGTSNRSRCGVDGFLLTTDTALDPNVDGGFIPYATADWDDPALDWYSAAADGYCDDSFLADDGTPCDEHLFCNGDASCLAGTCVAGADPCDDGVACTIDTCHEDTDSCTNDADDTVCDDGYDCSVGACEPSSGGCVQDLTAADGSACEVAGCASYCEDGACVGCGCYLDAHCDDGDPCTVGICGSDHLCAVTPRAPSVESAVLSTASCLTTGAGGAAVVSVDLRDEVGVPLEGASVTFHVSGTSAAWVEPEVMESAALPGTYYRTMTAPAAGTSTTISVEATACGQTVTLDETVTVSYESPLDGLVAETGGCSPQGGNLRVRAIDEEGNPIEGAFVMVGSTEDVSAFHSSFELYLSGASGDSPNAAVTDPDGYATFLDLGFAMTSAELITAGAENRAYVSLVSVGSSDVVLELPITSPPMDEVEITGDVSGSGYPGGNNELGMGMVVPILDLDFMLSFELGNLFENDVDVVINGDPMVAPGNIHMPEQCVFSILGMCAARVDSGIDPWTLRPYQSLDPFDIFVLHATIPGSDLTNLPAEVTMVDLVKLLRFENVTMVEGIARDVGSAGHGLALTHALSATMPVSITGAPLGDLYLMSISDLEGSDGLGRLMIQGMALESAVTDFSTTLTTHLDDGIFAGKRDLAMGLSLEGAGGFSLEIDRTTTGTSAARSFDSMFGHPSTTVTGRSFAWSGVVREGVSPSSYAFSRSTLRRDRPRGDWKTHSEPFWIVYAPGSVTSFDLPTLPSWAPRAADGGYLLPETQDQTNTWNLSIPYLGLMADPSTFDLDRHVLGSEVEWLTHVAGRTADLP